MRMFIRIRFAKTLSMSQLVWVAVRHEHLHVQASVQQREAGMLLTTIGCNMSLKLSAMCQHLSLSRDRWSCVGA
jgi:hypothetical protein